MHGFGRCEICAADSWTVAYSGPVRAGKFGNLTDTTTVGYCNSCGAERLIEKSCVEEAVYESEEYRKLLHEDSTPSGFFHEHDPLQLERLNVFPPYHFRNKIVADVGCAAGAFLDHIGGLTSQNIAIEPAKQYQQSLMNRGYSVYSYANEVEENLINKVDFAFSFSVIEHVLNPKQFLSDIGQILKKDGKLIISTPNRNDVLTSLLPDEYPSFFYRSVHRWYFDKESLVNCCKAAGFEILETKFVHRFGLSNAVKWLRDKCPSGRADLELLQSKTLNAVWRHELEDAGIADYMYFVLKRVD